MYLSAMVIIKNEDPKYLEEWAKHHLELGVEHIFILEHRPNEIEIPVLPNTTVWHCEEQRQQVVYYYQALQLIPSYWTLIVDADEFVVCKNKLPELLEQYEKADALAMNWLVFGSSNHEKKVYPIKENYHWHTCPENGINRHIKSIVKTKAVNTIPGDPHYFRVNTVNSKWQSVTGPCHDYTDELIRVNHYFTRSKEDWQNKLDRGRADCNLKRTWEEFHQIDKECHYDPKPLELPYEC